MPSHLNALRALYARGAQFVLCRNNKKPLVLAWQKVRPALSEVVAHARAGGLVGAIPGSLGCFVVDVDNGGSMGLAALREVLGAPITVTNTRRAGGHHAWYRAPADTVGNRLWQLSGAAGDIRGTNGYVVLWDAPQLADGLARGFDAAQPADPTQLPRPTSTRQGGPAAVRHAPVGARNETLNHEVFQDAMRGVVDLAAYRDAGHAAGLPGDEVERTLASAIQAGVGAAKPSLPKTRDGLKAALAGLGIAYRYNLRAERPELREGAGDWVPMNDRVEADVRARIAEHFTILRAAAGPAGPLSFGRVAWPDAFNALLYHAEVDPFVAWLDALPAWDEVARVSHWLARLFAADSNDPLVVWASRFLFLGAVWRAYQPGTKLDEMPVLIGPQGIGKSTALRLALPPEHPEWFSDGLHLAAAPKVRAEALQGRVIVEAAEMAGSTRAELESLKSFLSCTDDGTVRLAYRHNPETMLRRCIIVGSTNADASLPNDPTGNRRFVPVRLPGGDPGRVADELGSQREQLWAEATALYDEGVQAWLPRDLHGAQATAADQHRRRDELMEDAVQQLPRDPKGLKLAVIAKDVLGAEHAARLDPRTQQRLVAALTHAGWGRVHRRDGNYWVPPSTAGDPP